MNIYNIPWLTASPLSSHTRPRPVTHPSFHSTDCLFPLCPHLRRIARGSASTYRYLIAYTPVWLALCLLEMEAGLVNLLEHSKFLDSLEWMFLKQKGFILLGPANVVVGSQFTKNDAKLTKEIGSLWIHVKRTIRRIRGFSILQLH